MQFTCVWSCSSAIPTRKEGNVLFNNTLNTFYLRLYGVIDIVKDHSDCEGGNTLPPHGLLFPFAARVLLYASSHRQDNTYHRLCNTSHGALVGTRNSSMGPPHEGSKRRPIAPRVTSRSPIPTKQEELVFTYLNLFW